MRTSTTIARFMHTLSTITIAATCSAAVTQEAGLALAKNVVFDVLANDASAVLDEGLLTESPADARAWQGDRSRLPARSLVNGAGRTAPLPSSRRLTIPIRINGTLHASLFAITVSP
jgi:hypothetical protein